MADISVKYNGNVIAEMSESGKKTLLTSGKYCEKDIEINYTKPTSAPSGVQNVKVYDKTYDNSSGWVLIHTFDEEELSHINDDTFNVCLFCTDPYAYAFYSGCAYMVQNTPMLMNGSYPVYGVCNRQINETTMNVGQISYPANNTGTDTGLGGNGIFRVDGSNYYLKPGDGFIRNGNFRLILTW